MAMQTNATAHQFRGLRPMAAFAVVALVVAIPGIAHAIPFTAGDLVISVYGDGDGSGAYTDNEASPITIDEVSTAAAPAGQIAPISQIVLPQTTMPVNGVTNYAISGEYGSSSEGTLQLSTDGHSLTIAGYGVSAQTFNANPQSFGGGTKTCITGGAAAVTCNPLAQTASVANTPSSTGSGTAVVVPRVIALIGANGSVNTSTALTGVFNENNPRSVATVNGSSFYVSGQGLSKSDTATQGVFLAQQGATTATQIYGGIDTRTVSIQNSQLYVSTDSTAGSGVTENVSSFGAPGSLPTGASSPTILPNLKSKYQTTSSAQLNTLGGSVGGSKIYLSPENYFFANATTLYVADSGNPKGDNNGKNGAAQGLSDGGLQKWSLAGGMWVLDYTLSNGLRDFVPDTTSCGSNQVDCGTTGLISLAGEVIGNTVELFATNATLGDLDQTYLYGIDDLLSATALPSNESFAVLETAALDTNIRGVSFAPVPEPASVSLLGAGILALRFTRRRLRSVSIGR